MGLFGLGKKREKEPENIKEERIKLNQREHERHQVENLSSDKGEIVDISKGDLCIGCDTKAFSMKESIEIKIGDAIYPGTIGRITSRRLGVVLQKDIPKELIEKHEKKITSLSLQTRSAIDKTDLERDENLETNKAIINLMLEIDDPNTNIDKFKRDIEALPKLKEKIIAKANSIERARVARVEDLGAAIARLGFEEIREIVYDYINHAQERSGSAMKFFQNFELYPLLVSALFKHFAPLFSFKDRKSEGQSLLSMAPIGAAILSNRSEKLTHHYKGVSQLFSYEMRVLEKKEMGEDLIDVDRTYFEEILGVFHYIYDGFVLANFLLYPHYRTSSKILLGQRKFRYAYIAYLSILAIKYILAKDQKSGAILFRRLGRLGLSHSEAKTFLMNIITQINHKLATIGSQKSIHAIDIPSYSYPLSKYLGSGIYYDYFFKSFSLFDTKTKRMALRFEDSGYTHFVLDKMINYEEFETSVDPLCIIPCENLEDEDLPLDMFSGFDLIVFKNIEKLPQRLFADFKKLWRDFEGKIIVTYDTQSFMEYEKPQLFSLLKEDIIDFPSYFQNALLYMKMIENGCSQINGFFEENICQVEDFKEGMSNYFSLYVKSLERG